ncbi:uncharacterized protein LOC126325810 [Schistocerca gregaria]|uniref:uncharacterized protein LOC126325810 n=1 Tax=Schistocerca gregaria TaxID=7010 RepID=UPI00211F046A|nr:uncharacterized protein LOC126325810 [Schistocerca gregaria]
MSSTEIQSPTEDKVLRFTFTLNPDSTVDVDWKCKIKSIDPDKRPQTKQAYQGGTGFYNVLQKLEALHSGPSLNVEYGYEDDDFVVPESNNSDIENDAQSENECNDFYVNAGNNIENKKKKHNYTSDEEIDNSDSDEEPAAKRAKHGELEECHVLAPEVEECIQELEKAWNSDYSDTTKGRPGRFPPELEPLLLRVAQTAINNNKNKFITKKVVERVYEITGFATTTLKPRMKELIKRSENNELVTPSTEHIANVVDITRNVVQKVKDEIKAVLEGNSDPEVELNNMKNTRIAKLKKDLCQVDPELVWNQDIRMTIIELSFIEDTIIEHRQGTSNNSSFRALKSALYTDLSSLWPEGKMNNNKLTGMVATAKNKLKRFEDYSMFGGSSISQTTPPKTSSL